MALKPLTPVINSRPPLPGAPPAPIKGRGAPLAITTPHLAPLSILRPRRRASVHRSGPGPQCVDPVHRINRWKIICYSDYSEILQRGPWTFVKSTRGPDFDDFTLRPLGFSEINPWSTNFAVRSEIQKIFTKRSLASEKSSKIAPKLQKFISFQPQLQIQ
jgi:hypothetical protein